MAPKYFPLRWESTGDQWWFASPIDYAAANGHYELVRELLYIDPNLLFKLTSLPRIRRLESVWDDEESFNDVAKFRSQVAKKLLQECERTKGSNSLIGSGYGGWLLYSAASAGDVGFVKELLDRDPLLVFGEGEYGVTDILYAGARSKNCVVFRVLFDCCVCPVKEEVSSVFRSEMMNRAVHGAARGGNVEILREILGDNCTDFLAYRDAAGSTVLHSASAGGQVEVVKHLISSSYEDIINSIDNLGNTSLHIAAYYGHLSVVELLLSASPSSALLPNKYGHTFLHMALSGFSSPTFRRLDRQIDLMKRLLSGNLINLSEIINVRNNIDGRTALHMAAMDNIQSDVVQLLMSAPYVNLNIRDADGNTPLDLLKQQRPLSEILIKRLISAGGISNRTARKALVSHMRMRTSPGTSFRIPDSEIFLYTGVEDYTSSEFGYSGEIKRESNSSKINKFGSMLLGWPGKKEKKADDNESIESYRTSSPSLRQQYFSIPNNKRTGNLPSPSTKNKFSAGLAQGVLRVLPKSYVESPSSSFSMSSSPVSEGGDRSQTLKMKNKNASLNLRLMNSYLCFGAQGLAVEKSIRSITVRERKRQHVV